MSSMGVRAALAVLLLFVATVKAQDVTFWRQKFTMWCPYNGTWFDNKDSERPEKGQTLELKYDNDNKGRYYCVYNEDKYYFYVQGKVCENCFELDGALFMVAVVVDVVVTGFLMIIIYRCTKKKSSAGFTHTSRAPARPGGRGPPVPSPDYEQLQPGTLSQGTYSTVNRMG